MTTEKFNTESKTVGEAIQFLSQFPRDWEVQAYEGEGGSWIMVDAPPIIGGDIPVIVVNDLKTYRAEDVPEEFLTALAVTIAAMESTDRIGPFATPEALFEELDKPSPDTAPPTKDERLGENT